MRRSAIVVAAWALLVAVAIPFAVRQSNHLSGGGYDVPGSQAQRTEDIIAKGVPADFRPTSLAGVLVKTGDDATKADYRAALDALFRAAKETPGVSLNPAMKGFGLEAVRQRPNQPAVIPLTVAASEFEAFDVARELREKLGLADGRRYGGVTMHLVGAGALWAGMLDLAKTDLHQAELIAFPLVLVLLLAIFGSVVAALLPAALGAASVAVTGALIYVLSKVTLMNGFVTNVTLMIGLGVAVDYALFVVVRYREELRSGASHADARRVAMATSGRAVTFSGMAVIIAVAGVLLVDTPAIRSLAVGAIVVTAVAVLACATLLPALLTLLGSRIKAGGAARPGVFDRLAGGVLRHPGRALIASTAILLALTVPALGLKTGNGALGQLPAGNETRTGFEAAAKVTGPGRGAPLKVLVDHDHIDSTVEILHTDPEVVRVGVRTQTRDKRWVLIVATPRHDGDAPQVKALVRRLRAELPAGSMVGGNSAAQVDFEDEVSSSFGTVAAWVLVLTAVLLLFALRSVPLAIGAVLTNLLSVGAAFGILTLVFVHGSPGYVDTIAIPLVFAVVLGLSMDYQVFLLSRIRERWRRGETTLEAVRGGVAASGQTITSAAIVMIAVFVTFVITGVPAVKQIGLGAAVAIAIDATVVRLVLVPAAMALLGDRCWWWPGRAVVRPAPGEAL